MKEIRLYRCCGSGWKFDLTTCGIIIPGKIHIRKKMYAYQVGTASVRAGESFTYWENGKNLGERRK